jgi:hypothetical protein
MALLDRYEREVDDFRSRLGRSASAREELRQSLRQLRNEQQTLRALSSSLGDERCAAL